MCAALVDPDAVLLVPEVASVSENRIPVAVAVNVSEVDVFSEAHAGGRDVRGVADELSRGGPGEDHGDRGERNQES